MVRSTNRARKDLSGLPEKVRTRVEQIVTDVEAHILQGKKLRGKLDGKWSVRLGQTHRIICTFDESDLIVLTIKPRRDAYR